MKDNKLGFIPLVGMVIGSIVATGVFSLPADMSSQASAGAIIIGWCITGVGIIALALVFQALVIRKPELKGGIYSYARAGFGNFVGFTNGWGYWISATLANISFYVMLFNALKYFFPVFGNNILAFIGSSFIVWFMMFLVLKGVKEAAFLNLIATIGKLIPILIFIVCAFMAFKISTFKIDFWGTENLALGGIGLQVKNTMLITLWVFVGIEGVGIISGRAKKMSDVGKATVLGIIAILLLYIFVSILSLGVMQQSELAALETPSMAYVLESIIGPAGAFIVNLAIIISLCGALIGWTIITAEITYVMAKDGLMPKALAKENKVESASNSLILYSVVAQIFIIVTYSSESTYQIVYSLATSAILIPYLFAALYAFKVAYVGKEYLGENKTRIKDMIIAAVSSVYSLWLIYAAGVDYIMMVMIIYALGIPLYVLGQKKKNETVFTSKEKIVAGGLGLLCLTAVILLATGKINPLG